jgi:hypothetical protein
MIGHTLILDGGIAAQQGNTDYLLGTVSNFHASASKN